jgi:type II secretory pathway pseudopilin PulG
MIELMITVALIGILATIAIPSFMVYQLRSKRSEAFSNLAAIARTQIAYESTNGVYWLAGAMPGPVPLPRKRNWTAAAEAAFGPLGWTPEGNVYFDYDSNTGVGGGCTCTGPCFTATAYGELDGDSAVSAVLYAHPDANGNFCPAAVTGDLPVDKFGVTILEAPVVAAAADDF